MLANESSGILSLKVGAKTYELADYLGNVLVVVSDRKMIDGNLYYADLEAANRYYPFGMNMTTRNPFEGDDYRYGFNGMERDDEVKGSGNSYDFGTRMYDSRLGRWLAVDPLFDRNPSTSTFSYVVNNPVIFIDPDGENWFYYQSKGESKKTWHHQNGAIATYTDRTGKSVEVKSDMEKLVLFEVTGGTNSRGASTGVLKVYDQDQVVLEINGVFAGSRSIGSGAPEEGVYILQLGERSSAAVVGDDGALVWHMGIQKIPNPVYDEEGDTYDASGEWGGGRIRMVDVDENLEVDYSHQSGYYYHGKAKTTDATWGCIGDRSEELFNYFWDGDGKDYRVNTPLVVNRGGNEVKIEKSNTPSNSSETNSSDTNSSNSSSSETIDNP